MASLNTNAYPKKEPVCICEYCGKEIVLNYDLETYWIHKDSEKIACNGDY